MSYKSIIKKNAQTIVILHKRIHETFIRRDQNDQSKKEWSDACSAFHKQYDGLAFLGGTLTMRDRLRSGDYYAVEYALDFIELRPYFFRSGYMYKDLLRVLRNCPLSASQRKRYDRVKAQYDLYRAKCAK